MTDIAPSRRYRFGVFEADAALGELRKHGVRIKLNAQPFQVLTMLLEHPGELLTREQISRELWPDGTFVDYEHGVNAAVNRLREALGDTARNPRFVETLARRGYRFVAPVERIGLKPVDEPAPASLEPGILDGLLAAPEDLARAPHRVVRTLFVLLQLMYVAFYVGALANLAEIEDLLSVLSFSSQAFVVLVATAAALIPVRAFLLSAVWLHPPGARQKLLRVWQFLLPLDLLWALSPFLLLHHINFGLALACSALLVYAPFAQRSLVLMGAAEASAEPAA
jgi:DNA-binding winged helix-turn-helix (wHTH) protein